ncbi:glycoside hydrolase family 65 protein, partial [Streptomyces sp. SID11233]|nr:glycoside hydrolase family 65 protein [Streptomyces sp. SID11233]
AAAPECAAGGPHYPGTYAAGVYNRLTSEVAGQTVSNEDMVNLPNWLPLRYRLAPPEGGSGTDWYTPDDATLRSYRQLLDLRAGIYERHLVYEDASG